VVDIVRQECGGKARWCPVPPTRATFVANREQAGGGAAGMRSSLFIRVAYVIVVQVGAGGKGARVGCSGDMEKVARRRRVRRRRARMYGRAVGGVAAASAGAAVAPRRR